MHYIDFDRIDAGLTDFKITGLLQITIRFLAGLTFLEIIFRLGYAYVCRIHPEKNIFRIKYIKMISN